MFLVISCMEPTMVVQPFCANGSRRSWVDSERCTAILVGSTMLLSVFMPHSGCDEVDCIEAFESVRATLTEGKRAGAVDFFICGDLNIELKLDIADDDHQGLDSIELYGMYGPECRGGGGEDTIACEKKLRWLRAVADSLLELPSFSEQTETFLRRTKSSGTLFSRVWRHDPQSAPCVLV